MYNTNQNQNIYDIIREIRSLCGRDEPWNTVIDLKLKDEQLSKQYTLSQYSRFRPLSTVTCNYEKNNLYFRKLKA